MSANPADVGLDRRHTRTAQMDLLRQMARPVLRLKLTIHITSNTISRFCRTVIRKRETSVACANDLLARKHL